MKGLEEAPEVSWENSLNFLPLDVCTLLPLIFFFYELGEIKLMPKRQIFHHP
jgi:hypothetical protein